MSDFISLHIDLDFNLLQQILIFQTAIEQLQIISSGDYTERGSIRFGNCENVDIPKVAYLKRPPPPLKKAAPAVKAKQASKFPKPILTSLDASNNDYAVLSAASSKVDTSTLISVVQNLRTNEKEYRCSFCEYLSKNQPNTKRHVELKHVNTGIAFHCKTCSKEFSLKAHLKGHYMKVHHLSEPAARAMFD